MNASLGAAVRFAPTNIGKLTVTGGPNSFDNYGGIYKGQRAGVNLNANMGLSGAFGSSSKTPEPLPQNLN